MRASPRSHEWPLIIFTLLAQAAAGMAIARACMRSIFADWFAVDSVARGALWVIPGLMVVAAVAASFHLGRLRHGRYALANLSTSRLSREVLAGLAFGGIATAQLALGWFGLTPTLTEVLGPATAALGILLVSTISRLYRLRTVPAWDTWATSASFFASSLILGSAALAILVVGERPFRHWGGGVQYASLFGFGFVSAGTSIVQLAILLVHIRQLHTRGGVAAESAKIVFSRFRLIFAARILLSIVGAIQMLRATWPWGGPDLPSVAAGAALLFASEVLGRYLFYASHRRVGL